MTPTAIETAVPEAVAGSAPLRPPLFSRLLTQKKLRPGWRKGLPTFLLL